MSANVVALSQENLRLLSCHGQINRKSNPPLESDFSRAVRRSFVLAGGAIQTGVNAL
jgi:hypothetical protein